MAAAAKHSVAEMPEKKVDAAAGESVEDAAAASVVVAAASDSCRPSRESHLCSVFRGKTRVDCFEVCVCLREKVAAGEKLFTMFNSFMENSAWIGRHNKRGIVLF